MLCFVLLFLFPGKPIFSVDIHPDGTKFATGGQGTSMESRRALTALRLVAIELKREYLLFFSMGVTQLKCIVIVC